MNILSHEEHLEPDGYNPKSNFEPEKYHIDYECIFPDEYDEGLIDFGVDFDIVGTTS